MLISLSKRRKKVRSADSQNRSLFLKMLFGKISGDYGNQLMSLYAKGDDKFATEWERISKAIVDQCKENKGAKDEN